MSFKLLRNDEYKELTKDEKKAYTKTKRAWKKALRESEHDLSLKMVPEGYEFVRREYHRIDDKHSGLSIEYLKGIFVVKKGGHEVCDAEWIKR